MHHCLAPVAALLTTAVVAQVPTPLTAYWSLNEASGQTATDSGPNGLTGTLVGYQAGHTSWVTGQFGNALQFDGSSQYVDLALGNNVLPVYRGDGAPFSICFWVKAPAAEDDRVYSEGSSLAGSGQGALFTLGTGRSSLGNQDKLQVYIRNDAQVRVSELYSAATVFDDTWHHVAYVDTAGDARVYVDGVLDGNSFDYRTTSAGTQTSSYGTFTNDTVALGAVVRNNVVALLNGTIDEFEIYGFALSAADVQLVFQGGIAAQCSASFGEFGVGCGAGPMDLSVTGSAVIGGPGLQASVSNGAPNTLVFFCFGDGRARALDLGVLGFPGCVAWAQSPNCNGVGGIDPVGNFGPSQINIPNVPALACGLAVMQAVSLGTTIETSDAAIIQLGF